MKKSPGSIIVAHKAHEMSRYAKVSIKYLINGVGLRGDRRKSELWTTQISVLGLHRSRVNAYGVLFASRTQSSMTSSTAVPKSELENVQLRVRHSRRPLWSPSGSHVLETTKHVARHLWYESQLWLLLLRNLHCYLHVKLLCVIGRWPDPANRQCVE